MGLADSLSAKAKEQEDYFAFSQLLVPKKLPKRFLAIFKPFKSVSIVNPV